MVPNDTLSIHNQRLNQVSYYNNFSLLFRKYVPWRDSDLKFKTDKWEEFEKFSFDDKSISNLHQRNDAVLQNFSTLGCPILNFSMQTSWRLITGIGASSSLEVGMILHHIYGIPYIPSSSIKGLLHSYLATQTDWDKSEIRNLFGSGDDEFGDASKGKIVFLDAYPEPGFQISVDIMNNHYQKYYQGEAPPGDWMDPNPIKFLTVKDASFVFRMFSTDASIENEKLQQIAEKLAEALELFGIGAKTAVGYGRLENPQFSGISNDNSPTANQSVEDDTPETSFFFYADPDGTKEYYLIRLEKSAPFSNEIQWLFQKWELDEQWKNDQEIARAFLPKVKKEKKNGKETHFYKVIKKIIG
jgi:CRISPR-associated protein Cmr6